MQLFPLCTWPLNKLLMLENVQSNLEQLDFLDIREAAQGQDLCSALLVPKVEPASKQVLEKHLLNEWMNDQMAVTVVMSSKAFLRLCHPLSNLGMWRGNSYRGRKLLRHAGGN